MLITLAGWIGDRIGRKRGTLVGVLLGITGAGLMAGSSSASMFLCARVVAGLGVGFVSVTVLPWVSELSAAHDRGAAFSLVFTANFAGIAAASWLNFGVRDTGRAFRWRFPLAFMASPLLLVAAALFFLPESPR